MKWFAVNFIYRVTCGEGIHSPQFNEQIRLITAETIIAAINKARVLALSYNSSFKNCMGEKVIYDFIDVAGISEIEFPTDGVEVSSKVLEPESVEAYLKKLRYRVTILTKLNK